MTTKQNSEIDDLARGLERIKVVDQNEPHDEGELEEDESDEEEDEEDEEPDEDENLKSQK